MIVNEEWREEMEFKEEKLMEMRAKVAIVDRMIECKGIEER